MALAIASSLAADLYGVPVVEANIQDRSDNSTRFLVIGKQSSGYIPDMKYKSSFLVSIKDEVGALENALMVFAKRGLNLSKIESRPSGKIAWEYCFFIDVNGHYEEEPVTEAVSELKGPAHSSNGWAAIRILGIRVFLESAPSSGASGSTFGDCKIIGSRIITPPEATGELGFPELPSLLSRR